MLFAWRWPALLEIKAVTAAETQLVAGAVTGARDPLHFRWVDLSGAGPLAVLVLLPTHALGVPLDYFNARLVALLLDWGALVADYLFLRQFFPRGTAGLGMLPLALWLATSRDPVVSAYSSAHLSCWLSVWGGWLLWRSRAVPNETNPPRRVVAAGAGVCLGLLPWVNPGSAVIAAGLWLRAAGAALVDRRLPWRQRVQGLAWAGGVGLYGVGLMLALLHGTGSFADFQAGYFQEAVDFRDSSLLMAVALGLGTALAVGFGLMSGGGLLAMHLHQGAPAIFGHLAEYWSQPRSPLSRQIRKSQQPGDTMVVWGGRAELHIETGLPQAVQTRLAMRALPDSPERESLHWLRYLADLRRAAPIFFVDAVDAVGPGAAGQTDRGKYGHTAFPELADYVRNHYRLMSDDGQARWYVRADRVAQMAAGRSDVVPLTLAGMSVVKVLGDMGDLGPGRLGAHAPSRLMHPLPRGARVLRGVFGFAEGAYANPKKATDGALFTVDLVGADGARQRLLERRLDPANRVSDRGPIVFDLSLPENPAANIEFIIEPGTSPTYDWTYWGDLQVEAPLAAGR